MKKMKGMKRALSLLMCLIMVFGMLPMDALSVTMSEDGTAVYEIGDTVWVRGEDGEPVEESAQGTFWLPVYDEDDQPVTKQGLCEKAEHTHAFVCAEDCQLAHVHDESCYAQVYTGCVIHTHGEDCATESVYDCGKALHENHDGCGATEVCTLEEHDHAEAGCEMTTVYDCGKEIHTHENCIASQVYTDCVEHAAHDENCVTEQKLSCDKEEHACATEGCAADCATEEHTHIDECDMEGVYYKWVVVEDTSATFDEKGLPVHFFIAEPGQAVYPDGNYVNYREDLWGTRNGNTGAYAKDGTEDNPQINSTQGIRNANDESLITSHVFKWPDGYNATTLKNFGSIRIAGVTYSQNDYELKWVTICHRSSSAGLYCYCGVNYAHIHIDGVLSKKVTPAEMKLTKEIPAAQDNAETFNFKLTRLQQDSSYRPTMNVDTSFGNGGSINLTATIQAGRTSASIVSSSGAEIGFGYYMLEEHENERWETSAIEITRNNANSRRYSPGPVFIQIATDGTLRYSSTYNGTYDTATNITIENQRRPVNITYSWEGIPEGLTPLPEGSEVAPGTSYRINTSYPIGARVRGTGANAGKYYEFMGWQYYDPQNGEREYIIYEDGEMDPSTIQVNSDTNIHGLWTEHDLPTASGYITITKTFENKPADATFSNFYIAILHEDHETDITPALVGNWNADKTQWTYDFPISMSGEYTIVEGKYDVAGYTVTPAVSVTPVTQISTDAGAYQSANDFVSEGHQYKEIGRKVNVTLPYDTSVVSSAAGQADGAVFHVATVSFTNSYTKKTEAQESILPDLRVRKWDGDFYNTLMGATYELTGFNGTVDVVGDTSIYRQLQPGTYTLKEITAPEGYVKDDTVYTVNVVKSGEAVEELRAVCGETHAHTTACYSFVSVQTYTIEVPDADGEKLPGRFNPDPEVLRLNIPNQQIKADLNFSKFFAKENNASFVPEAGTILVDIYGPIVRDGNNNITGTGPMIRSAQAINAPDWILTVEDLPYGEYFVVETMASIHGYNWTGATFQVDGSNATLETIGGHTGAVIDVSSTADVNLNITNQYTTWNSADFYILKESINGDELAGAKFELFDASGADVTATYLDTTNGYGSTTNADGLMHFKGFAVEVGKTATFTLKETVAPDGYYLTTNTYKVTVTHTETEYDITITNADGAPTGAWNHADDLLTVVDSPILGQITVTKAFSGLKNNQVPEGTYVTFRVENEAGTYGHSVSVTANMDWSYTFTDLPLGKYTVSEIYASVDGYTYVAAHSVNGGSAVTGNSASVTLSDNSNHVLATGIPSGADAAVAFTNTYTRQETLHVTPANFTVLKRGEDGEALSGAVFTLFTDETCQTKLTAPVAGFTVEATTDAYGQARFTGLKLADLAYAGYIGTDAQSATYYLKETKAPANHIADDTVWKITISENKVKVDQLNKDKNVFETVIDWIVGIFTPSSDGISYTEIDGNVLAVENERIKGDLTVIKAFAGVDASALAHARVEIHVHGPVKRENGQITDIGPLVETINLSGENLKDGKLTAVVGNLEIGEYVLREPFASIHGYTWTNVTYSGITKETVEGMEFAAFEVDVATPDISITVTNTYEEWESADFYINKVKSLNNLTDGLGGAKFALYKTAECKEADKIVEATTGIAGYAYFSGFTVPAGETEVVYYLKEVTAPDNYYPLDTVWEVKITHDTSSYNVTIGLPEGVTNGGGWSWNHNLDTLNVENTEILGSITITKEITGDAPDGLNSIKVELVGNGIEREVELKSTATGTTPAWTATIDQLSMGTYYIVEQDANVDGYALTTTYYEQGVLEGADNNPAAYAQVTLDDANKVAPAVSVKVVNNYDRQESLIVTPASFTVRKVDAGDTSKTLDGAVFHLYKLNDDNTITTIATERTVNGIATFENLKMDDQDYEDYTNQGRSVTYYLAETDAPAGYKKDDTVWKVELSENVVKFDQLSDDKSVFEIIINWVAGLFKPNSNSDSYTAVNGTELTVSNQKIKGTIDFAKSFSFRNGEETVAVSNDLMADVSVEIHVHGPVVWDDAAKTTVASMGETRTLVLNGSDLTSNNTLLGEVGNLPLGDYLIHETRVSVHGFNWQNADISIGSGTVKTITSNGYTYHVVEVKENTATETANDVTVAITNNYEAWDAADFYVYKVDDQGNELSGATFGLFTKGANNTYVPVAANDQFTTTAKTGDDGLAHFHGFKVDAGESVTYYVMETDAPDHFHKNVDVWSVTISHAQDSDLYDLVISGPENTFDAATDTITVVNQPIVGDLTITKAFAGDSIEETDLVIKVKVAGSNGYEQDVELKKSSADNLPAWTAVLTNLPLGTYTVTEYTDLAKVIGYDLISATYVMDGVAGNSVTFDDADYSAALTITNTYDKKEAVVNNPDQFTIHKTDENGKPLAGAKFRLTSDHNPTEVRDFVTGADGKVVVDNLIGIGTLTHSHEVTYTLEEIEAPVGHELPENRTWTIKVVENDGEYEIELNAETDHYETIWDWIVDQFKGKDEKTLTVVNNRKTVPVTVEKVVEGLANAGDDEYVENLKDAKYKFELYIDGTKADEITISRDETTGEYEPATFEELVPYGSEYEVKEVTSDDDAFTSALTNASGTVDADDLNGITVAATNTYTFQSGDALEINMVKVAADRNKTPLSGAKFGLYDEDGTVLKYYESDKNGKFQIAEIDAPGTYSLKEIAAPSGYYKLDKPITISVEYVYEVTEDAGGNPVIVKSLEAIVAGKTVYDISENTYGVKNSIITDIADTGDEMDLMLWGGMTMTSLLCMAMMVLLFPVKKGKYQR